MWQADRVPKAETDPNLGYYMPGWIHRAAHQDAVDSILIPLGLRRRVRSEGKLFRNIDRWTLSFFAQEMLEWSKMNPGRFPTRKLVRKWVETANSSTLSEIVKEIYGPNVEANMCEPHILIAATPNHLTRRMAKALRGGAYHEALHTAYDVREDITFDEVWPVVEANWGLIDDWSKYADTVFFWMNEFADVKNEQRGIIQYPGIEPYLRAVHDFRIEEELTEINKLKAAGKYRPNSHSFAVKTFRYLSFGYDSSTQRKGMDFALEEDPKAVAYVTHGPMAKYTKLARQQWELPRSAKIDLAMRLVATFRNQGLIQPNGILADLLRREQDKITWGHCRIRSGGDGGSASGEGSGTGSGWGDAGSSIAEDALNPPQHLDTIQAVSTGVSNQTGDTPTAMTYDHDKVYIIPPSEGGVGHDRNVALKLTREVRRDITFYRSRLRTLVKAQEITGEHHGLPEGLDISDECLIDTRIDILEGKYPSKAYFNKDEQIDVSTAVYMLMDQSSSMSDRKVDACKIALSVVEAASDLGCPTMASGFYSSDFDSNRHRRWSDSYYGNAAEGDKDLAKNHHRPWGVRHEVFKTWDEKQQHIRWRFANYRAAGGTPMADGIQFALNAIQERREGHRIMFVVTDGMPDPGTTEMIQNLLVQAKGLGIIVVGCGFGSGASYVQTLFEESVWDVSVEQIPRKLIRKLNKLLDFRGTLHRGKRSNQRIVPKRG